MSYRPPARPLPYELHELIREQRFLDPKGLADRGIEHFDAWAATFGEAVETMEISPDGATLRRSRGAPDTLSRGERKLS